MDVVRRNIESLGGRVEINSSEGAGTEFVISLPLTLAILDGMCVEAEQQIFVVPLVNIVGKHSADARTNSSYQRQQDFVGSRGVLAFG